MISDLRSSMDKTAVIVSTYTGGINSEYKTALTKNLCQRLKFNSPYYLCLTSHSPIDVETQKLCDGFVYDSDNSFQINGLPKLISPFFTPDGEPTISGTNLTHGVAELTAVHNSLNYLERFGFTHFFKMTYDCDPNLDYNALIYKAQSIMEQTNKSFICSGWCGRYDAIGFLMFYSKIDFFRKAFPLSEAEMYSDCFELQTYEVVKKLGLLHEVYWHDDSYQNFLGYTINDYANRGGTQFRECIF